MEKQDLKKQDSPIFFIVGCQRSGMTLMRLILESHSKITCYDEPLCYSFLWKYDENQGLFEGLTGFKAPLLTEQLKEPFFSDVSLDFIIDNKFEHTPKIFLIRDVRDTICSMMRLPQGDSTWYHIWPERSLNFWEKTIPNFKSTFSEDLEKIAKSRDRLISIASFYWKFKNLSLFNYEQEKSELCKIKYEDLVIDKKKTIRQVIDFLNVEWEDSLLNHYKLEHPNTDERGITVGNTNTKIPIHSDSVGIYKNKLSKIQLEEIMNISGDLMDKLNYNA